MEVDLLAADERIAIEIDGGQHLGDAEAYRRDRRKDLLLQENGYLVLRFLAEDAGKRLDAVLDAILRTCPATRADGRREGRPRVRRVRVDWAGRDGDFPWLARLEPGAVQFPGRISGDRWGGVQHGCLHLARRIFRLARNGARFVIASR